MKTFKHILIYIIVTSLVTGCNQRDADQYEFVVFAHHENMNDELRINIHYAPMEERNYFHNLWCRESGIDG
ncbi:hypothetical protein [Paenibacillus sp. Soil522]|uniref:hypothetical protein n=1 Tax=Paenibacillus sp. Soil522 TaxID=1736388 RepID=UPI0007010265|nr:hypothetical protein [Paenibacillus sp. Soil522]KRE33499.1 hypothetical protein ASG81_23415 [Paenibacillus sp. Soil522]